MRKWMMSLLSLLTTAALLVACNNQTANTNTNTETSATKEWAVGETDV